MSAEQVPGGPLAYDLIVSETAPTLPGRAGPLLAGWAGPEGPAIDPAEWPRSPRTGQPLRHCLTLWLPTAYRIPGPDFVAASIFQWNDELGFKEPLPHVASRTGPTPVGGTDDPFSAALAAARPNPKATVVVHPDTGSIYAVVHLTEAELVGARQTRPALAPPFPGEEQADDVPRSAPMGTVWLTPRDDPNAGVAPYGPDYRDVPDRYRLFGKEHLGGTLMNPDGAGAGRLTPRYVEVSRLGGFDFAGGDILAFDLSAADPLSWAS